jgi:hypothetical protein
VRRFASNPIVGITTNGEKVSIPAGDRIEFACHFRDWQRVGVWWKTQLVEITRTAWENATADSLPDQSTDD